MSSGKILLGVLAGIAAGALVGILFAPDKGSETRRKIVEKGEDYIDGIQKKFNDMLDDITQKMDATKAKAEKLAADAKGKVEDVKAQI
jgi:gas vesicle protein